MNTNADPAEVQKFSDLAHRWWDPASEFKPLHEINPLRLDWIDGHCGLAGKKVLDVGCGGGLLSEGMAQRGAEVSGIDLSEKALGVARLHLYESGLQVDYQLTSAEAHAATHPAQFDVVTCMEMLEHVPNPESTVHACAQMAKPGGAVFFSTLNRNFKAYLFAVVGAEYLLNLLPRGTHDYAKFIKPSELSRYCRNAGLELVSLSGMTYNPITKVYALSRDTDVNYMVHARKLG
ncbi:bifunctional 2-polyprenyl-6-hydroxyphenol methylase/3-demethylubiquinol 3-O-methyltransferase UbiG [Azoarcus olearius]|uniref:Ubiquinone biosynthesis O-methyltransferase n=1 Tax=Azoarcus sp. (strain BH72) TaxID=418699 RepID=UBIG_AZOSB|nr:bifunctional 2-polyprenyl-6-hydroxyphenol methylase/3-demethylubiquinol 3-O-methyltransferase UbiG [Azoarcus olearius]A1K8Q1.1 RecName: Full=Ubiquinone biosynthesis O-methyltransferase; AltName: Full=2-polyprenyl-6-hydroxyphenol methylase; AltName: Full=3-demethylubiquinone 3-O-methyltransferase [Azoarcus olearius]ANQ85779.1 3-demethylubiquinone-9 3-methyltransferase [Azoarcus olearius]CAL95206.1 3-demethylubiquinone-9 3-O-methyltransferase [Azoarcus olearius]